VAPRRFGVERTNSGSSMPDYKFTIVATSMTPFTADDAERVKILMDPTNAKLNGERRRRKSENERINRRKDTLVKKAFELGEFDGIDVALIICKYSRYTTYRSSDYVSGQPSFAEIVSKVVVCLRYTAILIRFSKIPIHFLKTYYPKTWRIAVPDNEKLPEGDQPRISWTISKRINDRESSEAGKNHRCPRVICIWKPPRLSCPVYIGHG